MRKRKTKDKGREVDGRSRSPGHVVGRSVLAVQLLANYRVLRTEHNIWEEIGGEAVRQMGGSDRSRANSAGLTAILCL